MSYLDTNRHYYDRLARSEAQFAKPADRDELRHPVETLGGLQWLGGSVRGQRLLCLAAGGGRQAPLYAAAGAEVTVVDISPQMLSLDRQVATENELTLSTVETSMEDLSMLAGTHFDVVIQPVSTCYIPDITVVYREVARVIRGGGIYISQHKQPISLQSSLEPSATGYELIHPYYHDGALPATTQPNRIRETGAVEYLHRWEEVIGGMCRSGFVVEDLLEPMHADRDSAEGKFAHRSLFVPPYVRIKARRIGSSKDAIITKGL